MNIPVQSVENNFESSLNAFNWKNWISAGLGAIVLNCVLFLLLPVLMHHSSEVTGLAEVIDRVEVIRLKREKPPVRKKKPKPPEKPKEQQRPKEKLKTPKPAVKNKLILPFKLNSRLPTLAADFQIPFAENIGYGTGIGGVVDMGQLDEPLTPVTKIPPVYPMRARRKGIEGWVKVRFEVDEQGRVQQLQVLEGKPRGVFDKSVIQCVSKWRYKPGTVEGIAVRTRMETKIRFELE